MSEVKDESSKKKIKKLKSVTITLEEPIEWGEETIDRIVLRRPKAKDIEHLPSNPTMKDLLKIAQRCAKVPTRIIDELDSDDALKVVEAVGDFLDTGLENGVMRSY